MFTGHVGFCRPYVGDGFITDYYTTLMMTIRVYQKVKANVKMACVIKKFIKKKKILNSFLSKERKNTRK